VFSGRGYVGTPGFHVYRQDKLKEAAHEGGVRGKCLMGSRQRALVIKMGH
jgi:hypothetical protein